MSVEETIGTNGLEGGKGISMPTVAQTAERPLRIALVHAADEGGGAERAVLTVHRALRELGHDSRLYVGSKLTNDPEVYRIPQERPIPGVLRVTRWLENRRGWQNLYAPWFRRLDRLIGDVDVVHITTLWGGSYGYSDLTGVVALARRYPVVMTLQDGWMLTGHCACPIGCDRWLRGCGDCPDLARAPAVPRDATAWNWRRKRSAVQQARLHVTAVSHWLKAEIERSPIFAGKHVSVIANPVDRRLFSPGSRTEARRKLDIPPDRFVVLMTGQAIEGIRTGIAQHGVEALNRLDDPRILPLLVGRSAELVARTLRGPCLVRPFQKDTAALSLMYRAADVTLVTSEYETFGLIPAESQMCGTPVIAFATGGLTDVVNDGVTGLLVPTGDVDGLVAALRSLSGDCERLANMARSCPIWACQEYEADRVAREYVHLYRSVATARSTRASAK